MKMLPAIAAAMLVVMTTQACTQSPIKAPSGGYVWYDGGKPRQVQLDEALVAEFDGKAEPAATPVLRSNGVPIWRQ